MESWKIGRLGEVSYPHPSSLPLFHPSIQDPSSLFPSILPIPCLFLHDGIPQDSNVLDLDFNHISIGELFIRVADTGGCTC